MTSTVATGTYQWSFVDSGGDDRPVLVLLHGFSGCADVWDEIITELRDDFRCIAVDLPGHGRTTCGADIENYRLTTVADGLVDLLTTLDALPMILWGYSMGGRLALQYALRHPLTLTHLILESASPGIADVTARDERRERDNMLADRVEEIGLNEFADEWAQNPIFAGQHKLPHARQERMSELRKRGYASGLALSLRGMGTGAQEPLHARLGTLNVPTLIMVGDDDQKFREIGRSMHSNIAGSELICIADAGHSPYWEQPARAVAAVRRFCRRTGA